MTFKDIYTSLSSNFKEKTTNPFFGTFIIVWLIRNWEFVFTLYYSDSKKSSTDKIETLRKFFEQPTLDYVYEVLITIGMSFLVLIISYGLMNMSRLIINIYENQVTPWIYKKTSTGSTVLKSDYNKAVKLGEDWKERYDKERENRLKIEGERDALEEKLLEKINNHSNNPDKNEKLESVDEDKVAEMALKVVEKVGVRYFQLVSSKIYSKEEAHIIEEIHRQKWQDLMSFGFIKPGEFKHYDTFEFTNLGEKVNEYISIYGDKIANKDFVL